ncbi:MAG: DMT family transporter [Caldilineales bacterium]|nr:DMT family transporter [Caldilineales bacterium]
MTSIEADHAPSIWPYIGLGILAHAIWGAYPVMAKRAVAETPKFSLLFLASATAMAVGYWWMRRRGRLDAHRAFHILRSERALWGLALFVVLRSVSNIIAIELTKAVWVQLLYLASPFLVAILGLAIYAEPVPPYTFRALIVSSIGAVLVLVEDWRNVWSGFTRNDILGLGIALVSAITLAFYYLMVRRSHLRHTGGGLIMFQQGLAMTTTFLALSLITGEDWGQWTHASAGALAAALIVIFVIQVGGNLIQITALGGTNPSLITSLTALRLVSALFLAALILGEQLRTPSQWIGAGIVVAAVTAYLLLQRSPKST